MLCFGAIRVRALLTLVALAVASPSIGCIAEVDGGGDDDDGTGSAECRVYEGCPAGEKCVHEFCTAGESVACWTNGALGQNNYAVCIAEEGCPPYLDDHSCYTPLVLSFDGAPVDFTAATASFDFDLTGTGTSVPTDWPASRTPWLALDRDGDGRITGGGELFGSATRLADGSLAANGFLALAALDDNGDGRITPDDKAWPRLLVWSDRDGDRASTEGELTELVSRRLLSIDLGYRIDARCDARGNCEVERAAFRYLDETGVERAGDIVDVHLKRAR